MDDDLRKIGLNLSPESDSIPALIDKDKIVDEWLVKDAEPIPKMKKKRQRMSCLQVRTSKSLYNSMAPANETASEDMETVFEKNSNDSASDISEVVAEPPKNVAGNNSLQANKKDCAKLSFRIKVRITDKLLLVPILEDSCSIGWLAEQSALRYQDLFCSKPHLTLMAKDGTFLSRTDLVKNLFDYDEEIPSSVESWDEPSLNERYIHLCEKYGLKPLTSVQNRFSNFDMSPELNFSNCYIPDPQIYLIFSALQHFQNLQHLDISGTFITYRLISKIINCFPSFSSLISLNMSCCHLTIEMVKNISHYLQNQESIKARLPNLKTLILDSNVFQEKCDEYFIDILLLSSLRILSLYSCNLIPSFFENHKLCQLLKDSSLEELNVAGNTFSGLSSFHLLYNLPLNSLKKLNLSRSIKCHASVENMCAVLVSSSVFQEIHLEDCDLKDKDLNIPGHIDFKSSHLKVLNISLNVHLSCIVILDFLKSILKNSSSLTDVFMNRTCLWDMKNTEALIDILSSSNVSNLMLDNIPVPCQKKLVKYWENRWSEKASSSGASFYFKLSVL